jgi:hypothetical protein
MTTFKFHEGQKVAIRGDCPRLGLRTGDIGVIWALYDIEPPSYEVTFTRTNEEAFDMTLSEDEITAAKTIGRGRSASRDRSVERV